jgi:hypothetical protein
VRIVGITRSEQAHDEELDGNDPVRSETQLLPFLDRVTPRITFSLKNLVKG